MAGGGDAAHATSASLMHKPGNPHVLCLDSNDLARDPGDMVRPVAHVG